MGGDPITVDFTDELDGPLPGSWSRLVVTTDSSGNLSTVPEDVAKDNTYFLCRGKRAWWKYTRLPATGLPFEEHGYAASPNGVLVSKNADVLVVCDSPTAILDHAKDSLTYEVTLALRATTDSTGFVGGRVRAYWTAGVWSAPAVEVVRAAAGSIPATIARYDFTAEPFNRPEDVWKASPFTELRVIARDGLLTVKVNNALQVSAPVAVTDSSQVVLFVRAFHKRGITVVSRPVVAMMTFRSLRDLGKLSGPEGVPGDSQIEAPQFPQVQLPVEDLQRQRVLQRTTGRTFVFKADVTTNILGVSHTWTAGTIIRATEAPDGMDLVPVVVDYAAMRARSARGGE